MCSPESVFPCKSSPILEGLHSLGTQTGSLKNCCSFSKKMEKHSIFSQLLREIIYSPESFFPVRVVPILEGLHFLLTQTGCLKSCSLSQKDGKTWRYPYTP